MRNNGEAVGSSVVNDNKCLLQLFWDQHWQKSIERERQSALTVAAAAPAVHVLGIKENSLKGISE